MVAHHREVVAGAFPVRDAEAAWQRRRAEYVGDRVGEIESLAVAPEARGKGIGTALLGAARERFRDQGIEWWSVAVVEANEGAVKMYEQAGFGPYYRHLLGRIKP